MCIRDRNQIVRSEDFEDFANSFEADDKIFIISSIFGGTGASGCLLYTSLSQPFPIFFCSF